LAGLIVLQASVGALYLVHGIGISQSLFMVAVFVLFLPALVYALLTGLWLIRTVAELGHSFR
jgi:hypothetical protein